MDADPHLVEPRGPHRFVHGTAHDVLMAAPGLGDHFRRMGVLPASVGAVAPALRQGDDVIVWPGGRPSAGTTPSSS